MQSTPYVIWFADVDTRDIKLVGKKSRDLSEMTQAGFPIIPGFILTSAAYFDFLKENKLDHKIKNLLTTVNFQRPESIMQMPGHIKRMFTDSHFSPDFHRALQPYFEQLASPVRIYAYTRTKDFSKHRESIANNYLSLSTKVKDAWASHFSAELLSHRNNHNLDHIETGTELIIQKIIHPTKTGKIYTIDQHSHTKDRVIIETSYPHKADHYEVSKKTMMILDRALTHTTRAPKLTIDEIQSLARLGRELETHRYFPQEIDWAIVKDTIYIFTTKPMSTLQKIEKQLKNRHAIAHGTSITTNIATGSIKLIARDQDLQTVKKTDIIVIDAIKKSDLKHLNKAHAILCKSGSDHSEIATKLRQKGIPTLFNVHLSKELSKNGTIITVHAGKGKIYSGGL